MLRSKLTAVLAAALAVMAVSAVASASASAATFELTREACTGGTLTALCYEEGASKLRLTGTQSETVAGGEVLFTVLTLGHTIRCQKSEGSGTINQPVSGRATIEGKLKYSGCELTAGPTRTCVVNASNETTELLGTLINEKEIELKPKTAAEFLTITYSNKGTETCSVRGPHTVTGTENVEIIKPGTPETTKKGKAIGEGTLKFFSDPADLSQELTLTFTGLGDAVYVSTVA